MQVFPKIFEKVSQKHYFGTPGSSSKLPFAAMCGDSAPMCGDSVPMCGDSVPMRGDSVPICRGFVPMMRTNRKKCLGSGYFGTPDNFSNHPLERFRVPCVSFVWSGWCSCGFRFCGEPPAPQRVPAQKLHEKNPQDGAKCAPNWIHKFHKNGSNNLKK